MKILTRYFSLKYLKFKHAVNATCIQHVELLSTINFKWNIKLTH